MKRAVKIRRTKTTDGTNSPRRVIIVGGGFGGLETAHRLSKALKNSNNEVILISTSNYLLFTSMLPEVASGRIRPEHICAPARVYAPKARFINGRVTDIDSKSHEIAYRLATDDSQKKLKYDHLVLAVGAVPNYFGMDDVMHHAFTMKSLDDAIDLRNHVIGMLERADAEDDPKQRKQFLTFVVAGGGIAGVETVAELRDFVASALRYYPSISKNELRFVVAEMQGRILPEVDEELAEYAKHLLEKRRVECRLGKQISGADKDRVYFADGNELATRTLIWTTGNRPNPLAGQIDAEHNKRGQLVTDECLRIIGVDNIWAIGDIAQIPDVSSGRDYYPPTAQHAHRQGKWVARNIAATLRSGEAEPFRYRSMGTLVSLGHRRAVAQIRGWRFSGFFAWWMWRTIYLSKMPTLLKKIRVALDWTLALFFPRDIVKTRDERRGQPESDDDIIDKAA